MSRREVLLLALVVAAALAAAFSFRIAAHPGEVHDPDFEARFREAERVLPVLGAVRVRSEKKDAAHKLRMSNRPGIGRVIEPARALREFRYGLLLFGTTDEVRAVRDALRRKEYPGALPEMPRVDRAFVDRWGPYACDVVVDGAEGLASVRAELPGAELSGEPVLRAKEAGKVRDVPRALIVALVIVYAFCRFLRRHAERRLLAATLGTAVVCSLGWGVDVSAVAAIAIAAAAPRGPALGCGALMVFFPSMALKRMGVVFLVGAAARWHKPEDPDPGPRRLAWRVLLGLAVVAAFVFGSLPAGLLHKGRFEPAATFVERGRVAARAAELREAGVKRLVGDEDPVPPAADVATRRMLNEIYRRARDLVKTDDRFETIRDAAAVDSLYWPADLRARLRTNDGRAVLWSQADVIRRPEFVGSLLYRWRGRLALHRDAVVAAALLLIAGGIVHVVRHGTLLPLVARFAIVLLASAVSFTEPLHLPLLAMAALAPSIAVPLAMGGMVLAMPEPEVLGLAVLVAAVSLVSFAVSRPRRSVPPAQTGPALPAR